MKVKDSMYNVFVPYEDKVIAYNSAQDKFLLLDSFLYDLFNAAIVEQSVDDLFQIHPDFYTALQVNGFVVPQDINEYELVRERIIQTDQDDSFYNIIINPTMNCNFKCWYCYESHIKDSKMSTEIIEKVYKLIDKVVESETVKVLNISWFGGEPLLYFDKVMIPILQYANQKTTNNNLEFSSDITTNGFLINQEMIELFKKYNLDHNQITIDGHRALHNTVRNVNKSRGSYDEIISNVKLLCKNEVSTTLRINFTEETLTNITDVLADIEDMSENDRSWLEISFHQVWQTKDKTTLELTDRLVQVKKIFKSHNFNVAGEGGLGIVNSCYADKNNEAVINYNGDVFKCTARDFTKSNSEGLLEDDGTITWFEKNNTRLMAKLNNKPCQVCPILPLCGSGCSQIAFESDGEDYCVYDYDHAKKQEVVKDHFLETMDL